tara:strand:+ start:1826 stop:2293 length:468 start_codon:yes stop_codon:yes gene_type:complete
MKYKAIVVIEDKFWIIELSGSKVGTLKHSDEGYIFYNNQNGSEINYQDLSAFTIEEKKTKTFINDIVYGYSANTEQAFDIELQDTVPIFKKTATSTQHFAAGYYGIKFPRLGWSDAYCPRLKTLQTYQFIGPFKTQVDVTMAIKRKGQEYENSSN